MKPTKTEEPTKTKEQIVDAYENRIVLKVVSGLLVCAGAVSAIILSGRSTQTLITVVLAVSFVCALLMMVFAIRCPICDGFKTPDRVEFGVVSFKTGGFHCDSCNLSGRQIGEYVDLLKRGVDIDGNVIARFNRREL